METQANSPEPIPMAGEEDFDLTLTSEEEIVENAFRTELKEKIKKALEREFHGREQQRCVQKEKKEKQITCVSVSPFLKFT